MVGVIPLVRASRTGRALLGDFGLVRLLEFTCELAHTRVGTPYYLSPEPLGLYKKLLGEGEWL